MVFTPSSFVRFGLTSDIALAPVIVMPQLLMMKPPMSRALNAIHDHAQPVDNAGDAGHAPLFFVRIDHSSLPLILSWLLVAINVFQAVQHVIIAEHEKRPRQPQFSSVGFMLHSITGNGI